MVQKETVKSKCSNCSIHHDTIYAIDKLCKDVMHLSEDANERRKMRHLKKLTENLLLDNGHTLIVKLKRRKEALE